ncbi:unnamed protein product [Mytilus coruscus]|uniref:Uncharacterized protein n=1 Tax=Mytilus coruscus TaxID=42192 RepID=A0A6J8CS18_MYTCO|nr:unnamed protein product [Mytilus coruscus]
MCNELPAILKTTGRGKHLRNHVIDHWTEMNVKMVKVELYQNNEQVVWMTFNARNSNNLNWFSKKNLYQSSFMDLTTRSRTNYFCGWIFRLFGLNNMFLFSNYTFCFNCRESIQNVVSRRFYISQQHQGCPNDFGWLCIAEKPDVCKWAQFSKYPVLMYTKQGRSWNRGVNALLRKVATKVSPETELTVSGAKIKIAMKTGLFTSVDEFSLGEEYMKEIQGTWMKAKGEYEGGKLIIVQTPIDPKNKMKPQTVHREIIGDELVMTLFVGDVVCKRYFKKMT